MERDAASGSIEGIILAAGMSRRLGRPKQFLEIGGKPLLAHVIERALASLLDAVTVIVGHEAEATRAAIAHYDVAVKVNPDYAKGQSTSLIAGVNALRAGADATVVLLGDQPGIRVATVDALIVRRRATRAPIVMTAYGDIRSHPVLFGAETFDELREISGDKGARDVIRSYGDRVNAVADGRTSPPADVDTNEAYAAILKDGVPDR
ncbi:MAG: nucleotidyltransferase family protein [Chloroflexota bacterium]|nr:nucleotidyltransferase family protein [Chloroflexota bacterium]